MGSREVSSGEVSVSTSRVLTSEVSTSEVSTGEVCIYRERMKWPWLPRLLLSSSINYRTVSAVCTAVSNGAILTSYQ